MTQARGSEEELQGEKENGNASDQDCEEGRADVGLSWFVFIRSETFLLMDFHWSFCFSDWLAGSFSCIYNVTAGFLSECLQIFSDFSASFLRVGGWCTV